MTGVSAIVSRFGEGAHLYWLGVEDMFGLITGYVGIIRIDNQVVQTITAVVNSKGKAMFDTAIMQGKISIPAAGTVLRIVQRK